MKKSKAPANGVTAAELHQFTALHTEIQLAQERAAHARTRAKLEEALHEVRSLQLQAQRATMSRVSEALQKDHEAELEGAKRKAADFAKQLASTYSVDLTHHALCPFTGTFLKLPEGSHDG